MPETAARDYPQEIAYTGGWHIEPTATDETVRFGLSYPASASNRTTSTALASLGLTAQSLAGEAHPIDFRDARDAGTFECRGMAEAGRASGEFRFRPDPAYAELVRESGFPPLTLREHIQAGMFEIGSPFLKAIGASGIENVAFSDLVKMSVFKIKPEAIRELHAYFPSERHRRADAARDGRRHGRLCRRIVPRGYSSSQRRERRSTARIRRRSSLCRSARGGWSARFVDR